MGPEWVEFPRSRPSFASSAGWSFSNRIGLLAALGPPKFSSGGLFVRWQ